MTHRTSFSLLAQKDCRYQQHLHHVIKRQHSNGPRQFFHSLSLLVKSGTVILTFTMQPKILARHDRNHTSDDGGENDDDQTNDQNETTLSLQEVAVVVLVIIFILISLLIFLENIARRLKFQRDVEKDFQQQP